MATDRFRLDVAFEVRPTWQDSAPRTSVRLDQELLWDDVLGAVKTFAVTRYMTAGAHALEIELSGKPDHDAFQALKIAELRLGNIASPRFLWQGMYTPRYPEPWASQQRQNGIQLEQCLRNTDYLGWNGVWRLEFTVPIFTWIHQIEGLGWIYD